MKSSKVPDIEFKTMVIRMLKELYGDFKKLSENFNCMKKDFKTIKKQS